MHHPHQDNQFPHRCILHIGAHKTGSTAIQQFLFHQMSDARFRYHSFSETSDNGSLPLLDLFSEYPEREAKNRYLRISRQTLLGNRKEMLSQFERVLAEAAKQGEVLLLSGEEMWRNDRLLHRSFRTFLNGNGFSVEVRAYVRPMKSWMESLFQQRLKNENKPFVSQLQRNGFQLPEYPTVRSVVEVLDDVYGPDRVFVRLYDRDRMQGGCVVQDFCRTIGMDMGGSVPEPKNPAMSLPVIRLLYAYARFAPVLEKQYMDGGRNWLIAKLPCFDGLPLRFHSTVVAAAYHRLEADLPWFEDRLGFFMREDIGRDDDGPCVRGEADLFDFDPSMLDWLARKTGCPPVRPHAGEASARAVAAQLHRLATGPTEKDRKSLWHFFRSWRK
jgi:hypothetical protein